MRLCQSIVACSTLVMIAYSHLGYSANCSMDLSDCSLTKLRNGPGKSQVESRLANLAQSSDWDRLPDTLGENEGGKVRPVYERKSPKSVAPSSPYYETPAAGTR